MKRASRGGWWTTVGPARVLSHHLKYRALVGYARLVAGLVANRVPVVPLVPVPRALSRRLRYGIDPAVEIAASMSTLTGAPVLRVLRPRVHSRRRAGGDHGAPVAGLSLRYRVENPVALVDDVVTTGATVQSAIEEIGRLNVAYVVSANAANQVSSLPVGEPIYPL